MIGMLRGKLEEKLPSGILIDAGGVGYEVAVPMSTFCDLPECGSEVKLFIQMVVREDAMLLYGFLTREEKTAFQALVRVSGIGAKTALAVLSGMSVQDLASAVSLKQTEMLVRVPGIGKKTAERLILELKGKLGAELAAAPGAASSGDADVQADVVAALMSLGYSEKEAVLAAKSIPAGTSLQDAIRMALQSR